MHLKPFPRTAVFIAVAFPLLIGGCKPVARPATAVTHPPLQRDGPRVAFIQQGWHSGLVVPSGELEGPLRTLKHWFPGARYLMIGWGERWFYTESHPGILTGLRALFPAPSVLYVQGFRHSPPAAHILWRPLSAAGLHRLQRFLWRTFRHGAHDNLEPVRVHGRYPGTFFRARGTYDAFYTCNTWTITALHQAGLPVHATGILFSGQALSAVRHAP